MGSYLTGAIRKNGRREGNFSCQGVELICKELGFGRILAQDRLYDSGIAAKRREEDGRAARQSLWRPDRGRMEDIVEHLVIIPEQDKSQGIAQLIPEVYAG